MPTEGHDNDATGKDAFALTDEEYQKARNELFSSDADKEADADTAGAEEETASTDSQTEQTAGDKGQEEAAKPEAKQEDKPFTLDEPKPEEPKAAGEKQEPEFTEIVHRGQVHRITKEKLIELAQKGFDYDQKVGPHGRLVQIVDADRGAQDALNAYLRSKYGPPDQKPADEPIAPKLKPLAEYEDERQWLEDNVKLLAPKVIPPPPRPAQPNPVEILNNAIRSYDPIGSQDVLPVLAQEAQRLSVADSRRIEEAAARGDFKPFFKFYDYVKTKNSQPVAPVQQQQKPQFRMKTGGGEPPRAADKNINAWDMPAKDFQAYMAKVKAGYS